jgi:hypothetical protein
LLITDGWTAAKALKEGDVFTIATVFAVNPVTKATLPHPAGVRGARRCGGRRQRQYDDHHVAADHHLRRVPDRKQRSGRQHGHHVDGHRRHRLPAEPGVRQERLLAGDGPDGEAARCGRCGAQDVQGYSVRVIPYYDGVNDVSNWRLDVLYGVKTLDARLATRLSGS